MVKEQGVIEKIENQKAFVRIQKTSACDHCKSRGSCDVSKRDMIVEVDNIIQAKVGDVIELSMPEGAVMKLSILVYLLPILALLIGAFIGDYLAQIFLINRSLTALLSGGILMMAVFYALKKMERLKKFKDAYQPRLTRIITHSGSPQLDGSI